MDRVNRIFSKLGRAVALLMLMFIVAFAAFTAQALPGPTSTTFDKGALFTVAGYTGASTLSGFPVLVRIAENSPSGFSYDDLHSKSTGADIAFVGMDGTGLPFEIDTWNTNGTSLVWVRLPSMTNGTEFVMCWGGATSGKIVCDESPFSGYVGVWHMSEASGTVADSSGHSLDAVPTGGGAATLSVAVSGPVGNGRQCSNSTSTRSYLKAPSYNSQSVGDTFAISGWFNVSSSQSAQDARLVSRKENWENNNGWELIWKKDTTIAARGASKDNIASDKRSFGGGWKHLFVVYNGRTATLYENGVQMVSATGGAAATDNNVALGIGDYPENANQAPLVGSVDECRLLDAVPGADWAKAEYDSMDNAAFLTASAAQPYGASAEPQVGVTASDVSYTNATFVVSVSSLGMDAGMTTDASWADLLLLVGTDSALSSPLFAVPLDRVSTAPSSVSKSLVGLSPNTTYYAQVRATNSFAVAGESIVAPFMTPNPAPVFTASVNMAHLAPDITLTFTGTGWGEAITRITVDISTSDDFSQVSTSKTYTVNLATMPANFSDFVLAGLPTASTLYYRFTAENAGGYSRSVEQSASSTLAEGDNVWSGLSEDIDDPNAYIFVGGLPAPDKTLYFTTPAGLSPVINQDTVMPSLRFWNGETYKDGKESVDTAYFGGYHSCGYHLSGSGVLTFNSEKPIVQASYGTNTISNPIRFSRSDSQSVTILSVGEDQAWLNLNGALLLPDGVSDTTMKINGRGNTVLGGASPDFMGQLSVEGGRLTFANSCAMTNVSKFYFTGDPTSISNAIGAPLVFPRMSSIRMDNGWPGRKLHEYGAPFVFPQATFEWGIRDYNQSTFEADWVVSNVVVRKHGSNSTAVGDKTGYGAFIVKGETTWYDPSVKSYVRLYRGCFYPETAAGLPPSGEFYLPNDHVWRSTLGLSDDFSPMLDGSSTPRFFQSSSLASWGFTGFGGERTVCWNADPTLNLTNTTDKIAVTIPFGDAAHTNVAGKAYSDYYAYPARFMFGNRSEFADGTILFLNPIRYEFGQDWDAYTYFESTNHVVAARLRGSLKLGTSGKTWNFSGNSFGGYLALEADNSDFTGRVNVREKGNLLVNSNLVARSVTVQSGSGLGGTGSLSTLDGMTVKSGGALFGGEWNKGGVLTLGGTNTFESGSALRVEAGSSDDGRGSVKLAAGSTLKLTAPVYVDVDTDPRVSPVRGAFCKVLDWSEATFESGSAPTRGDFVVRPELNSDLKKINVSVRDDGLYVGYITVRCPQVFRINIR